MIQPRLIRYRDAPAYCGVGRTVFDRDFRPYLREARVGEEGIAFDRHDLDALIDHLLQQAKPPRKLMPGYVSEFQAPPHPRPQAPTHKTKRNSASPGKQAASMPKSVEKAIVALSAKLHSGK